MMEGKIIWGDLDEEIELSKEILIIETLEHEQNVEIGYNCNHHKIKQE